MGRYVGDESLSVEEAVSYIENGMRVLIAPACGEPRLLMAELARQAERFERLEVVGGILCGDLPILAPELKHNFHYTTWHVTQPIRRAVAEGYASYVPLRYSDVIRTVMPGGALAADVMFCSVSEMDAYGYLSLGPTVSYTKPLAHHVPFIIAEQNPNVPWTLGESILERQIINGLVQSDAPLPEYPPPRVTQVERDIARYVGELIPNGATLQVGVGSIPEAIVGILPEKRDLAVHCLVIDSMVELFERGIINARRKNVRTGYCDICELMGTRKLMKFAERNPLINMLPATVTHDVRELAAIDNFISICSALQIDLTGQVNAEGIGDQTYASVGGQFDFVLGSRLSEGGRSIFALPSTGGQGGRNSRIVARFEPGTPVTTPRHMVEYVVTEYGIAELKGKSLRMRARELISIAHPSFREELEKQLHKIPE